MEKGKFSKKYKVLTKKDIIDSSGKRILNHKLDESTTHSMKKAINIISIDPDKSETYGSASFKELQFASDIDVYEETNCCTTKEAINKLSKQIKELVKRVEDVKKYFFVELKAGLDNRYNIYLGYYCPFSKKILDYRPMEIKEQIKKLYDTKLLNKVEYDECIKILSSKEIDKYHFDILFDLLREHRIVRWSGEDILKGYKMLPLDVKMTLEESLTYPTVCKVDIWANVNKKMVELSNFFIIYEKNKEGFTVPLAGSNIIKDLQQEIIKFGTGLQYKPYKCAKRLWSLCVAIQDIETIQALTPLFNSDGSRVNQVISEIDLLTKMFSVIDKKDLPLDTMFNQIDQFKYTLSFVNNIKLNKNIFEKIDYIIENQSKLSMDKIIKELDDMKNHLKPLLDKFTISYLQSKKLDPIPLRFFDKLITDDCKP